jgi:hypothetical protein
MNDDDQRASRAMRLRHFAEIYSAMLAERPYMEMLARHHSMKTAELTTDERVTVERYLKANRLNDLLHPDGLSG